MPNRWSMLLVVCSALAGYAWGGRSVQAQPAPPVFRTGETVTFVFGPDWSRICRIEEMRETYVRCQNDAGVTGEYWINSAQVAGVQKRMPGARSR